MNVELPDHLLRKIRPRRSVPGSAKAPSKRAVASLRKKMAGRCAVGHINVLEKGIGRGPNPELAAVQEAAVILVRDLSVEALQSADLDVLAAAVPVVSRADCKQSLVPSLVLSRGLVGAVHVAAMSLQYSLDAGQAGWTTAVYLRTREEGTLFALDDGLALRHAVCSASDDAYEGARTMAAGLRTSQSLLDRAYLADVFPDEPWADEDLAALLEEGNEELRRYANLMSAARDPELVRALCQKSSFHLGRLAVDVACGIERSASVRIFKEALPKMLAKPNYGPLLKTPPRNVATALGLHRTREVAEFLAPYLGSAVLGPVVAAFFQDNAELLNVLETHATGRGGQVVAEQLLAGKGGGAADGPEAAAEEVPPILRARPWRPRKKSDRPPATVLEGVELLAGYEERVDLQGEPLALPHVRKAREITTDELAVWREGMAKGEYTPVDYLYAYDRASNIHYARVPADEGLRAWTRGSAHVNVSRGFVAWVQAHGLAALPGFIVTFSLRPLGADDGRPIDYFCALTSYVSPRMAPRIATIMARRKKFREPAGRWLLRHADAVVAGLIPPAVGGLGAARQEAEAALLFVAGHGATGAVTEAASRYGDQVAEVIGGLLSRDPLSIDVKPVKLPSFLRPGDLPPVCLESGKQLPADARDALVEMLSTAPGNYLGFDRIREACDEESLAAFAAALLEAWVLGDAPGRHEWMLHAVVIFPTEESTRRVAALARDWARRKKVKALRACEALRALGTDHALLHLGHIAETSRFQDLRDAVRRMLESAAADRGLSREELEDRTVPDLGLGSDGTLTFSFGERTFVASLTESLAVVVRDSAGKLLSGFPRTRKEDDAAAAKVARKQFNGLKKDVAAIAARQVRRYEQAMVDGRWLGQRDFVALVVRHPVLMRLAQGLVWEAQSQGGELRTFRVAEDGTFADLADEATMLAEKDSVRVAHPLRGKEFEAAWSARFDEYELLQPFTQLGRSTFEPAEDERDAQHCRRAEGTEVAPEKLLGLLEARGYHRNDAGFPSAYRKTFAGGIEAEVPFGPGIEIANLKSCGTQTLGVAVFRKGNALVTLSEVEAVIFSEVVRDLEALSRS